MNNHFVCEEVYYPRLDTCSMCRAPLGPVEEDCDFGSDDSAINEANYTMVG